MIESELVRIKAILGREPTEVEKAIYDVMWSEHCSYKSSFVHIKKLFDPSKNVVEPGEENAGGVLVERDVALLFKMESHNHPSAIEPFNGAATGVGGILRDIFAMGARPMALLDALHFGPLNELKARIHLDGVVRGISRYANCVGIPTVGGETLFHNSYLNNPIINIMAIGICEPDKIIKRKELESGTLVVLAGAKTGRDGLCGASFASSELNDDMKNRLSIQIGDPFFEKLLMEFTLELNEKGIILSAQDLGAGGIASALAELASRASKGVSIELDKVPVREKSLTPGEILLSESQERMAFAVMPGYVDDVRQLARKYGIDAEVIGVLTGDGLFTIKGRTYCRIPINSLIKGKGAPSLVREFRPPSSNVHPNSFSEPLQNPEDFLLRFALNPNVCSKRWIYEQYDQTIGTNTIIPAGDGSALLRVKNKNLYIALSVDSSAFYSVCDPFMGGMASVAMGYRKMIVRGANPVGITDCLNFPSPEEPEKFFFFVRVVDGIKEASQSLGIPVISGNVSFYNESQESSIIPTPVVATVGVMDYLPVLPIVNENDIIVVVGETKSELNGTLYELIIYDELTGVPPMVELEIEKKMGKFISELIAWRLPSYIADISYGGIMKALLDFSFRFGDNPIGVVLDLPAQFPWYVFLFSESQPRYLLTLPESSFDDFSFLAEQNEIPYTICGRVYGDSIIIKDLAVLEKEKLKNSYLSCIYRIMGG